MKTLTAFLFLLSSAAVAHAQAPPLKEPQASPAATINQTVGMTDITVSYHRPAVNGRPVWGKLVPFGEVWRAGANENTTVTFSSDVKIEGQPLKAGVYGLHMIPTAKEWTVIFSNMSLAWGSFSYDQKEDALRVTVTPRTVAPAEERLSYRFDNPGEKTAVLTLTWEKLAVPIKIEVDTAQVVMTSMRGELRGLPRFGPEGWTQAAAYWVAHGGSIDEAQQMVDRSIAMAPSFANQMTRSAILEKKGDAAGAKDQRAKALAMANERELNLYGYRLVGDKKLDEAIAIFQRNAEAHPDSWNVHDSLGEALAMKGDKKAAVASYKRALSLVKDPVQQKRIEGVLATLQPK